MNETETKELPHTPANVADCVRALIDHRRQELLAERKKILDERSGTIGQFCRKLRDNCRELALLKLECTELPDLERDLKNYPN